MREVYVVAAVRTPIGKFGGVFKDVSPVDLGAHAMREALARAGVEGKALPRGVRVEVACVALAE